ncbi:MAG: universal stress protein, partial [Conexivisphaerales archaeon]
KDYLLIYLLIAKDRRQMNIDPKSNKEWGWTNNPILLPLAYDRREWNAAYIAAHMAEYCGARIILFHVSVKNEVIDQEFRNSVLQLFKKLNVETREINAELAKESFEAISKAIVDTAASEQCQAIIMAAHKESFFIHILGRVSDRVARKSHIRTVLVETPLSGISVHEALKKVVVLVKPGTDGSEAFVLAAALTSLATSKDAELIAAQAILLPQTVPLDEVEFSKELRQIERDFANSISMGIKNLGRPFIPRVLAARDLGKDIGEFIKTEQADLVILTGRRSGQLSHVFGKDTEDIVRNSPSVAIVVFAPK